MRRRVRPGRCLLLVPQGLHFLLEVFHLLLHEPHLFLKGLLRLFARHAGCGKDRKHQQAGENGGQQPSSSTNHVDPLVWYWVAIPVSHAAIRPRGQMRPGFLLHRHRTAPRRMLRIRATVLDIAWISRWALRRRVFLTGKQRRDSTSDPLRLDARNRSTNAYMLRGISYMPNPPARQL